MIQNHLHRPYEFGIRHYAAPIKYDARMFIERNLDKIPADLLKCACQSNNTLIREEFKRLASTLEAPTSSSSPKKRSEATKHLVVTKFKHQLTSLMSLMKESRTRYIRCVKPNKTMTPRMLDHPHTVSQLESAGLVTAIVISRESFPNRLSYELVMERCVKGRHHFSSFHVPILFNRVMHIFAALHMKVQVLGVQVSRLPFELWRHQTRFRNTPEPSFGWNV